MVEILTIIVRWMAGLCTTAERLAGMLPVPASALESFHTLHYRSGCRGEAFPSSIGWNSMRFETVPLACHGDTSIAFRSEGDTWTHRFRPPVITSDFANRTNQISGLFSEGMDACAPPFGR